MAITQNTYTGNGSTVLYSFAFPYLNTADVKVSINGTITTAYTFANATTIQFNTAPANGAAIRIYRETNDASLQAVLSPGSSIRASDLNDNFDQLIYLGQEANTEADSATATANTALTNSATAISTANTASTNASAAVSTANTASANASAAVTTANTASTNASNAVSTANTASTNATTALNTANSATTTANNATSTANTALSTANTALTNANAAVSTANTASTNANNAVSTANTASTNATNAVNTANTASTNATTAVNTANSAVTTANAAAAAVANAVLYTTVANVAAIPGSPSNNTAIEVTNSTGIESFTPLSGLPAGFVGSSGLSVRLIYQTAGATWTWIQYFPNDPETRYFKLSGGTITGPITVPQGTVSSPGVKFSGTGNDNTGVYSPGIDELGLVTNGVNRLAIDSAGAVSIPGTLGVTGAITGSLTGSASNNVLKAGDTMTGALGVTAGTAGAPSVFISGDTNTGIYSPGADQVAISTGGSGRLFVDASGRVGINKAIPSQTLQVVSATGGTTARFENTSSGNFVDFYETTGGTRMGYIGHTSATDMYIHNDKAGPLVFDTNNAERLRITSAGLVGVGTSSPATALDVNGTVTCGTAGGVALSLANGTAIRNSAAVANTIYFDTSFGSATHGSFEFRSSNAATTRMIIDSSGRCGIGTTSPGSQLGLSGGTGATHGIQLNASGWAYTNRIGVNGTSGDELIISQNWNAATNTVDSASYGTTFIRGNTSNGSLAFGTGPGNTVPTTRLFINNSGAVGIGTASPLSIFDVKPSSNKHIVFSASASYASNAVVGVDDGGNEIALGIGGNTIQFFTGTNERARIDSSGRLLVGTSSARIAWDNTLIGSNLLQVERGIDGGNTSISICANAGTSSPTDTGAFLYLGKTRGTTAGSTTAVASGDCLGRVSFQGSDGTDQVEAARVEAFVDGTPGANDMPGRLVFSVTSDGASSPTERMRITNAGHILFGTTDADANISGTPTNPPVASFKVGNGEGFRVSSTGAHYWNKDNSGSVHVFRRNGTDVGSISISAGATAYNTSSDYRLKENVEPVLDGITRLQQLKPSRFNFISDPDRTVDGFLAHEVQVVVPEAIHGTKDEVDDEGNPIYQGIDQSKLVPLLTAALQEAIAKIESLEARLTAAGI